MPLLSAPGIAEPPRKSILGVLKDNLAFAKRVTYVHRIIYIGGHTMKKFEETPTICDVMQQTIKAVNSDYCEEKLTGLLLYYPMYFCHMLEGAEDSIAKHFEILSGKEEWAEKIVKPKLLVAYHHINQRFFNNWLSLSGKPPTLLEKIDPGSDLETTYRHIYTCIRKLYGLALQLRSCKEEDSETKEQDDGEVTRDISHMAIAFQSCDRIRITEFLPEYNLLDFLLNTPHIYDVKDYTSTYGCVADIESYKDMVWPIPSSFIPFNVFTKNVDPIQDLPPREGAEPANVAENEQNQEQQSIQ